MKKILYILFGLVLIGCKPTPEVKLPVHECATPPEGRAAATCFATQNTIFILSGRKVDGTYSKTLLCYDVRTDSWQEQTQPLTARVNGAACVTTQGVFVGLGFNGVTINSAKSYLRDWWLFDPRAHTWTRKADFPSDKTNAAVCWSDERGIWVASGFHGFTSEMYRYDITADRWETLETETPLRVMSAVSAKCGERYFYGTGYRRQSKDDWYEWFTDGHWEKRASVPGGRLNAACDATDKAVWIVGGWHYGDTLTTGFYYEDIIRYTPSDNRWTRCGLIPCGTTENGVACAVENRLYFGLGEDKQQQLHQHWYYIED